MMANNPTPDKPAKTEYTIIPALLYAGLADAKCKPNPPLMMPSKIKTRPYHTCRTVHAERFCVRVKRRWWMYPKKGWRRRAATTIVPRMVWALL